VQTLLTFPDQASLGTRVFGQAEVTISSQPQESEEFIRRENGSGSESICNHCFATIGLYQGKGFKTQSVNTCSSAPRRLEHGGGLAPPEPMN
jgi:hypothetical protein